MSRRAVRVARALALLSASGCSLPEGITPEVDAEASVDAAPEVEDSSNLPMGDGRGHCLTADDGNVTCDPGMACTYADSVASCIPKTEAANPKECGLVVCDLDALCFCANARTSVCLCNFSAGPLSPPDLVTWRPAREARTQQVPSRAW
jgi:hypothetical protein